MKRFTPTFKYYGKMYSVTRMAPDGVIYASKCLKGRRLRGRPAAFIMGPADTLKVRPIIVGR